MHIENSVQPPLDPRLKYNCFFNKYNYFHSGIFRSEETVYEREYFGISEEQGTGRSLCRILKLVSGLMCLGVAGINGGCG